MTVIIVKSRSRAMQRSASLYGHAVRAHEGDIDVTRLQQMNYVAENGIAHPALHVLFRMVLTQRRNALDKEE
jgi:hypothetical protein